MGPFNFYSLLSQRQFKFNMSKQTHYFFFQACSFSSVHECIHSGAVTTNYQKLGDFKQQICALTVLEIRSLKSSLPQKVRYRGAIFPWLLQLTVAPSALGLWPHHFSLFLHLHLIFTSSPCMSQISLCLSLRRSWKNPR